MILDAVMVFLFGVLVDVSYVLWMSATVAKSKIKAGAASVLIAAPAVFGVTAIVDSRWLSLPYFAGLFLGTVLGIRLTSKNEREKKADDE